MITDPAVYLRGAVVADQSTLSADDNSQSIDGEPATTWTALGYDRQTHNN